MYKTISLKSFLPSLFLIVFLLGCGSDDSNPTSPAANPEISVSTSTLSFDPGETEKSFTISNSGEGNLEWTITTDESWLSITPVSGSTTSESDEVTVIVNRSDISDGSYDGTITIQSNAGSAKTISVQMVIPAPELNVSVKSLNFGNAETQLSFEIVNNGGGTLEWSIASDEDLVTTLPSGGETTSETDEISVTISRAGLSAGDYTAELTITSNVGNHSISISMSVGELIWSYGFSTDSDLDRKWECGDSNDDWFTGDDYWGTTSVSHSGSASMWCNGRGDHPDGRYDNNMGASAYQKADEAVDIRSYSDVTIRFWMEYETEMTNDYVQFIVRGNDDRWYYIDSSIWTGGDYTWRQYEVNLSDFGDVAPTNFLRIGYYFYSDISAGGRGVLIDDIEIWGINEPVSNFV